MNSDLLLVRISSIADASAKLKISVPVDDFIKVLREQEEIQVKAGSTATVAQRRAAMRRRKSGLPKVFVRLLILTINTSPSVALEFTPTAHHNVEPRINRFTTPLGTCERIPVDEATRRRRAYFVAEFNEVFPNGVSGIGDPYTMTCASLVEATDPAEASVFVKTNVCVAV